MHTILYLLHLAVFVLLVQGQCTNNDVNTGGPFADELTAPRVFAYEPDVHADQSTYPTNTLTVVQYNIQSGYSLYCQEDLAAQAAFIAAQKPQFYAIQEVNVNVTSRCGCSMPQAFADATGMSSRFFRTFFFQDGLYGHGNGAVYDISETRSLLFNDWTSERRGLLALITYPPQFLGRAVILVSNHYQYDNEATREGQANETIAFVQGLLEEFTNALIIMPGDYYTEVGQTAYFMLLSYFNNSWNDFNGNQNNGYTHPSDVPTNRFDHVWYKIPSDLDMYVQNFQIPYDTDSDHRPCVVTFAFPSLPSVPNPPVAPTSPPTGVAGCQATITTVPRAGASGSWMANGVVNQIFDVSILNSGSCTIEQLSLDLTLPAGASLVDGWNIDLSSGSIALPSNYIQTESSFTGAGVIVSGSKSVSFGLKNIACGSSCSASSTLPPSSTPFPASQGSCSALATYGDISNTLTITNTGTQPIQSVLLTFSPSLPSNNWNLLSSGSLNQYTLPWFAYQSLAAQGSIYTASGFYGTGTPPAITISATC